MNIHKSLIYLRNVFVNYTNSKSNYRPHILSYLITNQCNSHCVTCNAWQKAELSFIEIDALRELLQKPLFSEVQHVGISGGEPSTFNELLDHISVILGVLPKIETLSITSNCILSDFWIKNITKVNELCKKNNVYFQFNISLDGIGKMHDKIRGTKGNFDNTSKVIDFVRANSVNYQLHTTIDKYNVYHVSEILAYAKSLNADIIFRLASRIFRLDNEKHLDRVSLNSKELSFICDFFTSDALLSYTKSPGRKLFYKHLVKQVLGDGKRLAPCYFKHQGLVLASDGSISFCSRFSDYFATVSDSYLEEKYYDRELFCKCELGACEQCYHDQTGLWPLHKVLGLYLVNRITPIKKSLFVFTTLLSASVLSKKKIERSSINKVCVFGMYGGEHVGDAAILGGCILRTLRRYPHVSKITIYSFRKDRTQCWVENLINLPSNVKIEVCGCDNEFIKKIKLSDLLLWAGGPVMELPVVLSRNYLFIRTASSAGIPFEMEGVGYGPINTSFGRYIIKRILNCSSYITVRSLADKNKLKAVSTLNNNDIPRDPAFSYLELVSNDCVLDKRESQSLDLLLSNTQKKIVAINLRPLWSRYGKNESFNYDSFLKEIVDFVNTLKDTTVVFFPMNADQYGFSDLDVAYEIKNKLNADVDFRIWEIEPTINGVVSLLRKVDAALCMRFHAVIFAQSQNTPVIGIDYSLTGKGKVSTLFNDETNVIAMKNFTSDKVLNILKSMVSNNSYQ